MRQTGEQAFGGTVRNERIPTDAVRGGYLGIWIPFQASDNGSCLRIPIRGNGSELPKTGKHNMVPDLSSGKGKLLDRFQSR